VKGLVSKVRDDAEENFFDRINRIYRINRNRRMKKRLPRRRGGAESCMKGSTHLLGAPTISYPLRLCVFA